MNAIAVNLILAVLWLLLGIFFLAYGQMQGAPLRYRLPLGLAALFTAFNLYRAFSIWSYRRRRRREMAEDEDFRQRLERRHPREPRHEGPPDPNFIFTEEPPEKPV